MNLSIEEKDKQKNQILLTISHIKPLDIFPVSLDSIIVWDFHGIFEFVTRIWRPGNIWIFHLNELRSGIIFGCDIFEDEFEFVVEKTLGDETTWNGWSISPLFVKLLLWVKCHRFASFEFRYFLWIIFPAISLTVIKMDDFIDGLTILQ